MSDLLKVTRVSKTGSESTNYAAATRGVNADIHPKAHQVTEKHWHPGSGTLAESPHPNRSQDWTGQLAPRAGAGCTPKPSGSGETVPDATLEMCLCHQWGQALIYR